MKVIEHMFMHAPPNGFNTVQYKSIQIQSNPMPNDHRSSKQEFTDGNDMK